MQGFYYKSCQAYPELTSFQMTELGVGFALRLKFKVPPPMRSASSARTSL